MTDEIRLGVDLESILPKLTTLGLLDLPNGRWPAAEIPTGVHEWYRYALAYKDAGDRLVGLMGTTYERNMLGPPMLFLYRHSIELHLKSLLLDAGQLLDDPQTVPPKHYLMKLWTTVRAMVLRVGPNDEENEWLLRADSIIQQFDDIDPTSFAFRYPVDTDGSPALPADFLVDPSVIKQVVAELNIYLDGASCQISEYQGFKYEGL
jgi:hypothetical protein